MIGILITNLGTPDAPTPSAVKRYLKEFLSDPRVVEIPSYLWLPILHGIILQIRPRKSAALYKKIWAEEGSPLLTHSKRLTELVENKLKTQSSEPIKVVLGMSYGNPSIKSALQQLRDHSIDKLIVLPLYPQYSGTTTASVFDAVSKELKKWRHIPHLHLINNYHNHPLYIQNMATHIASQWQAKPDNHLLFSFHGIPKRCVDSGDPYMQQCLTTAEQIAQQLQLPKENWSTVFQSRFGYEEWLQPYCDLTLKEFPSKGIKDVTVVCPGFAVDCLETLEEIALLNQKLFLESGGEKFTYIPALNDRHEHVDLITSLLTPWIDEKEYPPSLIIKTKKKCE